MTNYLWSTVFIISTVGLLPHAMSIAPDCSVSNDTLGRLVFDCTGHHFTTFPSNIPTNILVLLLRKTMVSPTVPSFQAIGLEKLQVLDLSWNNIYRFSGDIFKNMTSLSSLDVRGNHLLSLVEPNGLFEDLINLRMLQIDGLQFQSYSSSDNFIIATKCLKSLESLSFQEGYLKFGIHIASHYTYLSSLVFKDCNSAISDGVYLTLAQVLNQLQNLTKLEEITITSCGLITIGNLSLGWMSNVRNINLACNPLNIIDIIHLLGSQSSLSRLNTLILDHVEKPDCTSHSLNHNTFCNLSFSLSLRRLSLQTIGIYKYEVTLLRCLPNLRSFSIGHDLISGFSIEGQDTQINEKMIVNSFLKSFQFLYSFKASFLLTIGFSKTMICNPEDNSFDQYFIDESQFHIQPSMCEYGSYNATSFYIDIKLPSCLRAVQVDHFGVILSQNQNIPPVSINIASNNNFELLDLSNSIFTFDGLFINVLSITGLINLRSLKFRHMNIKLFHMVTLNHANNLRDIDLSVNRFEKVTGEQMSRMFTKPINIHSLNLSACDIAIINHDFLRQFPRLTLLDFSYNKLLNLSCNLLWLISNDSLIMDFSFNQISTLSDCFVESIKQLAQYRQITLNMTNNPFRCDCDTLAFLKWFQSTKITIEKKNNITCIYRGVSVALLSTIDIADLEYQCTKFIQILYISIGIILSITTMSLLLGVILFKYRWQIRWHWFRAKRKFVRNTGLEHESPLVSTKRNFACFANYFGVPGKWIMREIVTPIEKFNIGDVFIFERNGLGGLSSCDAIMDTINDSRKLLYVVGNEPNAGDQSSFFLSLQLAAVERLSDIIVVYKEVAVFELLQKKTSILRPNRKSPIKFVQYEANDMFWSEMQQLLQNTWQEVDVD